jgi:two-component system NarL family sensor kinase
MRLLHSHYDTDLAKQTMEATEQIIQQMGAELHDDLVQKLTIVRLSLDKLERTVADPVETLALITRMKSEFDDITQSIRAISRQLIAVPVDGDTFHNSIDMLCQNMERPGGLHIRLSSEGTEAVMPTFVKGYIYRIIQELIHNAFKHSSGWHIWVRLLWKEQNITVEVEDDGSGFARISESVSLLKKKYNTLAMRTRAIGATLTFERGQQGLLARLLCPLGHK